MKKAKLSILLTTIVILMMGNSYAQNWDYELYPRADVELSHLDAELKIDPNGSLQGDLIYTATLKNSYTDSIFFDEASLDIQSVTINGEDAEFLVQDLKLIIIPDELFNRNTEIQIGISYSGNPSFGIHKSASGSLWTSMLPLTTRHWLPVIDSPRTQMLTDFVITHPAGSTVIANGRKGINEVVDTEYERTSYSSGTAVSASSLAWVLFDQVSTVSTAQSEEIQNSYTLFARRSGPQIHVYSEAEENIDQILQLAAQKVHQLTTELSLNVPSDDIHIIIQEDDFLETKQFGNGLLFVYKNKGDISRQIERGLVSMFSESLIKAPAWSEANAARLIEAYYMNMLDIESKISGDQLEEPYHIYSAELSARWQLFLEHEASEALLEGLKTLVNSRSEHNPSIMGWTAFARDLYEFTGRSWITEFELPEPILEAEDTTYTYTAVIDWEEGSTSAEIRFEADNIAVDELVTVSAEVIGLRETRDIELTFTGSSDGVVLNVPAALDNIKLSVQDRNDIVLNPQKPFLFWMYQLRSDESEEKRAEAALEISSYSENPDIELLLNDMLRGEDSNIVIANILKSMAAITNGASGTDERFLQYSGSQHSVEIRASAIEALGNYDGNERVVSRLQSIARQQSDSLQIAAIMSLSRVVETERLVRITNSFIDSNVIPHRIPLLLRSIAEKGAEELAVELADKTLEMNIPYDVTQDVVHFLINTDSSPVNWQRRLPEFMRNPHPAVRLVAAEATGKLSAGDRGDFLETVLPNEFDERVRRKLRGE